jgi:hypothetical protein
MGRRTVELRQRLLERQKALEARQLSMSYLTYLALGLGRSGALSVVVFLQPGGAGIGRDRGAATRAATVTLNKYLTPFFIDDNNNLEYPPPYQPDEKQIRGDQARYRHV